MFARDGSHGHLQHAVDAVLDDDGVVHRLYVDIGRAALKRGKDGRIHQADDGADVFFAGELLDRNIFVGIVFAAHHVEGEAFAGFLKHALRLLGLLQDLSDLRERGNARHDAMAEQPGNLVEHHQLRGVADGDHQRLALLLDGHEVVAEHQFHRHRAQQVVLDLEVLQVDELGVIALGERLGMAALVKTVRQWNREYRCICHMRYT